MIYLDYQATTPVNKEVLESFNKTAIEYFANPNSIHKIGMDANNLINDATKQIAQIFKVKESEIIYTSCSSESNNLAIKGIAYKYQNRGKHIITTMLEHSSVIAPLGYLQDEGFEISFVDIKDDGLIDLDHLKTLLKEDTILVSISAVDSEVGIKQNIEEISKIVKQNKNTYFHVDATQAIGKINIDLEHIDLLSLSAHKFYGIKGMGILIKKEKISLTPIIHGGKSTTIYRSGTPSTPLIVSTAKALRLAYQDMDKKHEYVTKLNKKITEELKKYDDVIINSTENSIPHVINFSLINIKPETFVHALEEDEIYISTKSACSTADAISKPVYAVTKNKDAAFKTLRISLSYLTTEEEIDKFLDSFKKNYERLDLK